MTADRIELARVIRDANAADILSPLTLDSPAWDDLVGSVDEWLPEADAALAWFAANAAYIAPLAAQAADVGACGANGGDQAVGPVATELGGQRAVWDGGGGWL